MGFSVAFPHVYMAYFDHTHPHPSLLPSLLLPLHSIIFPPKCMLCLNIYFKKKKIFILMDLNDKVLLLLFIWQVYK